MPRLTSEQLRRLGYALFEAAGCSAEDARTVTDHLVESNLFGHDSHGAIRIYEYLRFLRQGRFQARAEPQVLKQYPCVALVDGGGALGQIGATFATRLAIRMAREHGTGTMGLRNCAHVGRVGAYPLMAAREGLVALAFVNAGHLGYQIAPWGGIDGRLSTNPVAFAAPRRDADPIMVDMTTSVVAEGKIRLAINEGKALPEGWIIDHQGRPSTDPEAFKGDPAGAILPLGWPYAGHKGTALSFIVEVLAGALGGQGCSAGEREMVSNGLLLTIFHIEHFTDRRTYDGELETLIRHAKSSRLAPGFTEILVPGEPEFRTANRREAEGIEIDETTWGFIRDEAARVGVAADGFLPNPHIV